MALKFNESTLTRDQFIEILQDNEIVKQEDIAVFQVIYAFEGHKAYASQVARILGKKGKNPHSSINLQIGRLAKRIARKHDINFTIRSNQTYKYWDLFFNGWDEGRFWVWQLKDELVEALTETELTGEILHSEELRAELLYKITEGAKKVITVNAYERNSQARRICIEHYGAFCTVCDFNFEKTYGELGKGFIHVHHLIPVSYIGKSYELDPVEDLRPVCPNCHAMLHTQNPPLTIEELQSVISANFS
ncbi:HNH endonuclease [Spirosoma terrae]|uniref:HNH endonuclease n=2 Tax=Spirosoma terrae TaxID=1968276 RepID=A0A6L9LCD3_9BACT|nr:HNH endonuclease [Spirosoma terrae]